MSSPAHPPGCPVALDPSARALQQEAAALRELGPAARVEIPGGVIAWSVTRHEVIKSLTSDPRVSRNAELHWPERHRVPEDWALAPSVFNDSFLNAYGEEHRRLRRMVSPSFTPRRVQAMAPAVLARTRGLVDDLARTPAGTAVDLRASLSHPLTLSVLCDLLGVPEHMREPTASAISAILDTSLSPEEAHATQIEMFARLADLLEYKRRHPAPDLASDLINPSEGSPLPDEKLIGTLILLVGAGFETAVNLITSAARSLLTQPHLLKRMRRGDVSVDDVVEESLRRDGPVMYLPLRYAVEDIDLGEGVVIGKGEPILIGFAAAGRDPAVHPQAPEAFDPDRSSKEHLAFGHGAHFCLGSHLARMEARTALSVLFETLPEIALADPDTEPPRLASIIINGPSEFFVVPRPGDMRARPSER